MPWQHHHCGYQGIQGPQNAAPESSQADALLQCIRCWQPGNHVRSGSGTQILSRAPPGSVGLRLSTRRASSAGAREQHQRRPRDQQRAAQQRAMRIGYVSTVAPSLAAALRKKTSPGLARRASPLAAAPHEHGQAIGRSLYVWGTAWQPR